MGKTTYLTYDCRWDSCHPSLMQPLVSLGPASNLTFSWERKFPLNSLVSMQPRCPLLLTIMCSQLLTQSFCDERRRHAQRPLGSSITQVQILAPKFFWDCCKCKQMIGRQNTPITRIVAAWDFIFVVQKQGETSWHKIEDLTFQNIWVYSIPSKKPIRRICSFRRSFLL